MSELNVEELLNKHKKERRELQAQIQSLKKTCGKGDKKKKKEITEQIAQLEQELDEQQERELDEFKNSVPQENTETNLDESNGEDEEISPKENRITKAQKRRNKKAAEDREREERIRVQDQENKRGPRLQEAEKINKILLELGMRIYSVPADGNCLYGAINHQLKITERDELTVADLRKLTAKYMREHKDDILPFMSHEEDDIYTEEQYEKYCSKVANTTEWGGQIEILALSNALKCPIKVIQASSAPTVQGADFEGPPLVLSYHRHLYRLGEHYNSTAPI